MGKREAPSFFSTLSATFLVAGTSIGGGMLALPIATGLNGFFPSIVMMAMCWFAMTLTALLLLEVTLWFGEGAHIMTMTEHTLGKVGKAITAVVYLFICYASLVAYADGGGKQFISGLDHYMGLNIPVDFGPVLFVLVFYAVVFLGAEVVGRVNTILFAAMILAYLGLVGMGAHEIKAVYLQRVQWSGAFLAIPLLLTSFSFQTMVPSLVPYLKRNMRALRIAVIGGTSITFLIYFVWQALILGIVSVEGEKGLEVALLNGEPPTLFLRHHVESAWVYMVGEFFAFFALGTSFLGIGFGLYDFIADGLHLNKKHRHKWMVMALIVVPTLIFVTLFERVFLIAMSATGGFGDAILNGMIPVLMIWVGRYSMGHESPARLPIGKIGLIFLFLFFLVAMGIEFFSRFVL
jgi:tyrosine-specific transport protein